MTVTGHFTQLAEIGMQNGYAYLSPNKLALVQHKHLSYGAQVSLLLHNLGGEHTFQPKPEELALYMMASHAVIVTDHSHETVGGFMKMDPWIKLRDGVSHDGLSPLAAIEQGLGFPVGIEVGSLVVAAQFQKQGLGKFLTAEMSEVARVSYPDLPVFSVVTKDNIASLKVFGHLGWPEINHAKSLELLQGVDILDGWPHPSSIFLYPY